MNKIFLKDKKPENCIKNKIHKDNNTITHKHYNTKDIIHISGETSKIETPSECSLRGTRGATISIDKFYEAEDRVHNFYKSEIPPLKNAGHLPFYIAVSVKGHKSHGARREVNIDIIPKSGDKPIFLKSHTVHKQLKWELYRDLPDTEQTQAPWDTVLNAFNEEQTKAGKIKFRRRYTTVPRGRISHAACITQDVGKNVHVLLCFGSNEPIQIVCTPVNAEFFNYKGDWKNETEEEGLVL